MNSELAWVPTAVVLAFAIPAAVTDLRSFRVPNSLTLAFAVSAFLYHGIVGGSGGLATALAGAAFGAVLLLIPYLAGGTGAGDLKLLTGFGAWLGTAATFEVFVLASIFAAGYALVLSARPERIRDSLHEVRQFLATGAAYGDFSVTRIVETSRERARLVPFAAMLALGGIVFGLVR